MTNLLAVENVTCAIGKKAIVENLSLSIRQNEIVGLLGPNGSGKTTLLESIMGFLPVRDGTIHFDGVDVRKVPTHDRVERGLGYLPQGTSVFQRLSVVDNLQIAIEESGVSKKKVQINPTMDLFELTALAEQSAGTLSGGERRRLEIARTFLLDPRCVLLDEPFAGLDPKTVDELKLLIRKLAAEKKVGILLTDHNVKAALELCDRAYLLSQGKIVYEGPIDSWVANEKVRNLYLGNWS